MESFLSTLQIIIGAVVFAYGMMMHARITRGGPDICNRYIAGCIAMLACGMIAFGFGVS